MWFYAEEKGEKVNMVRDLYDLIQGSGHPPKKPKAPKPPRTLVSELTRFNDEVRKMKPKRRKKTEFKLEDD